MIGDIVVGLVMVAVIIYDIVPLSNYNVSALACSFILAVASTHVDAAWQVSIREFQLEVELI